MTKAILVRKSDHAVVGRVLDTAYPQWLLDPETGRKLSSPATVGWENDIYLLAEIVGFVAPSGKHAVGHFTRTYDADREKVFEKASVEDAPIDRVLVPKRVIIERLHAAGLLEQARAALDAAPLYTRERWNAREAIYADDPVAVALITAIGGNPDELLAVKI